MNNLEAKEKLYNEWQKLLDYSLDYAGISEAYKTAFKALELEPCVDAVSRQAVIEITAETGALETQARVKALPSVNPQTKTGHCIALEEWKKDFKGFINELLMPKDDYNGIMEYIDELPVTPQPKTGHWVYKIYGGFHEQGNWYCSHCDYQYNYGNGHAKHCPECGYEMSEPPTEEKVRDKDYDWVIRR